MNRSVDITRLTNALYGVVKGQVGDPEEAVLWFGVRLNLGVWASVGIPTYEVVKEEIGE